MRVPRTIGSVLYLATGYLVGWQFYAVLGESTLDTSGRWWAALLFAAGIALLTCPWLIACWYGFESASDRRLAAVERKRRKAA